MIKVVFSSRVSLLAFYFRESFKRTSLFMHSHALVIYGSLTEEKDKAGSAKVIKLGM